MPSERIATFVPSRITRPYHSLRKIAKDVASHLPKTLETAARRVEEFARGMVTGGTLFEELGFFYVEP